jgi:hypothetical protein
LKSHLQSFALLFRFLSGEVCEPQANFFSLSEKEFIELIIPKSNHYDAPGDILPFPETMPFVLRELYRVLHLGVHERDLFYSHKNPHSGRYR